MASSTTCGDDEQFRLLRTSASKSDFLVKDHGVAKLMHRNNQPHTWSRVLEYNHETLRASASSPSQEWDMFGIHILVMKGE
jgi:hypothetical protein